MSMLVGCYQTLLLVLALSGVAKVVNPGDPARALVLARMVPGPLKTRFRMSKFEARLLGLAEITLALGGFISMTALITNTTSTSEASTLFTSLVAGSVALMFVGFNLFIQRLTKIDPDAGCGCFGASTAPPGPMHIAFNYGAAAVATVFAGLSATAGNLASTPTISAEGWGLFLAYVALLALGATLFLRGPALVSEVNTAISLDRHDHTHANTFSIDHSALTPRADGRAKRTGRSR